MKISWKHLLLTVAIALIGCATSFALFYKMNDEPAVRRAAREGDAMAWLQAEFHLDDAQFAAIKRLHDAYGKVCARHCTEIMEAQQRSASPQEIAVLEDSCVQSMTQHFREVAALMPANEGARYLATVLPRISHYDHSEAPNLQVTR